MTEKERRKAAARARVSEEYIITPEEREEERVKTIEGAKAIYQAFMGGAECGAPWMTPKW